MIIRSVTRADRPQWDNLWQGYLEFYKKTDLDPAITQATWSRFFDALSPMHGMVAEQDGVLVGLVHYIFHPSTWLINDSCYLEDLFCAPARRGHGVGRALIEAVYEKATAAGSRRVYWHTDESNAQAQILYDKMAKKPGFILYRKEF